MNSSYSINKLDQMRLAKGEGGLVTHFNNLIYTNRSNALELINDDELQFTTLFMLKDNIHQLSIIDELNERNKIALEIIDEVEENQVRNLIGEITSLNHVQTVHYTLRWIIESVSEKIVSKIYNEVVDICAVFLVKIYKDIEVLPVILELMFNRKKNKEYLHELVWAFFDCHDRESLMYIVDKLKSQDEYEVELACKLLNFIPNITIIKSYEYAEKWMKNNEQYLYFTGQSQHECMNPIYCNINLAAKYLNKKVNANNGEIKQQLNLADTKKVEGFKGANENAKIMLANYSQWLNKKSLNWWNIWISYPLDKQIRIAQTGGGELYD